MLEMTCIFIFGIFNVKISKNAVINSFSLNFAVLFWIKSMIYDDLIRILNDIDKDLRIYF